jgi:hypothetical protein
VCARAATGTDLPRSGAGGHRRSAIRAEPQRIDDPARAQEIRAYLHAAAMRLTKSLGGSFGTARSTGGGTMTRLFASAGRGKPMA